MIPEDFLRNADLQRLRQQIAQTQDGIEHWRDWREAVAYAYSRAQATGLRWRVQNAYNGGWETLPAWLEGF